MYGIMEGRRMVAVRFNLNGKLEGSSTVTKYTVSVFGIEGSDEREDGRQYRDT